MSSLAGAMLTFCRFKVRQVVEARKAKLLQKFERRTIDDGTPGLLKPTQFLNQTTVDEGA